MRFSLSTLAGTLRFDRQRKPDDRNPIRDWFLLLAATAILLVLFLVLGVFAFLAVRDAAPLGLEFRAPGTLDREALRRALDAFEERARALEALRTSPPGLVDPSR